MRRILSPREIDILLGPKKDRDSDEPRTTRRKRVLRSKKNAVSETLDSEPEPVTA